MKRVGIIAMCFAAVLAFSAVTVASASATELLFSVAAGAFSASGGEATLIGASEIKCTKTTTSGTITNAHLGKITITFEGCKAGSIPCNSPNQSSGVIVFPGEYHFNLARSSATGEPHAAVLILVNPSPFSFSCGILGTVEVRGSVIGLLFKKDGSRLVSGDALLGSKLRFLTTPAKSTTQENEEFLLALTTPENQLMTGQKLEANIFGGTFKPAGQEGEAEITAAPAGSTVVTG
jgi:hypothetical protein